MMFLIFSLSAQQLHIFEQEGCKKVYDLSVMFTCHRFFLNNLLTFVVELGTIAVEHVSASSYRFFIHILISWAISSGPYVIYFSMLVCVGQ